MTLQKLNDKGQCPICKIKPLVYKREGCKFCLRCNRDYNINTNEQEANFFYNNEGERIRG
jgi:hypothetical protein